MRPLSNRINTGVTPSFASVRRDQDVGRSVSWTRIPVCRRRGTRMPSLPSFVATRRRAVLVNASALSRVCAPSRADELSRARAILRDDASACEQRAPGYGSFDARPPDRKGSGGNL